MRRQYSLFTLSTGFHMKSKALILHRVLPCNSSGIITVTFLNAFWIHKMQHMSQRQN